MIKTWKEFVQEAEEADVSETNEAKVPEKYLTRSPKAMKKEIKKYKGTDTYKKDWEADYDKKTKKRYKTKKSASSIAYQKKFGEKK